MSGLNICVFNWVSADSKKRVSNLAQAMSEERLEPKSQVGGCCKRGYQSACTLASTPPVVVVFHHLPSAVMLGSAAQDKVEQTLLDRKHLACKEQCFEGPKCRIFGFSWEPSCDFVPCPWGNTGERLHFAIRYDTMR